MEAKLAVKNQNRLNNRIVEFMSGVLRVGLDNPSSAREQMVDGIKSMVFLCVYCNKPDPISLSVIDFQYDPSGSYVTTSFICRACHNKFAVKIQDLGRVEYHI